MNISRLRRNLITAALVGALGLTMTGTASAHCDSLDGPVITEAGKALANGDVAPLLKWVPAKDEATIRSAFAEARQVRQHGAEARQVADLHFYETLVRVHRASEGAPYTGIKPAGGIDPAIAAADAALADGDIDALVAAVTGSIENGIRERYRAARASKASANAGTASGRIFVSDYVRYVHYVENLHNAAAADAAHGATDGLDASQEKHAH